MKIIVMSKILSMILILSFLTKFTVNHPIFNTHNKLIEQMTYMCDMAGQYIQKKEEEKQIVEEQAAKNRHWKIPICYDDDDDEESSIPLIEVTVSGLPLCVAITPDLPITDSLIMEDEHLDTIPATESNELIKSSVEDLVQIPSESEDSSDDKCDLPLRDDSPESNFTNFSNPLFDTNADDTSSDEEDFKITSNPLFDLDEVSPIADEVLESIDSIPPGIDSFDAESNLIESLLHQDTSINDSKNIDSLLDEFIGELTLPHSM
ncbi:hypothetical protein Tco_0942391 [Tanacetum coccineum]